MCGRVIGSVFFSLQFRFCFTVEFPSEGTDLADSSGGGAASSSDQEKAQVCGLNPGFFYSLV